MAEGSGSGCFKLSPSPICSEDILFCIDVGAESLVEMKSTPNVRSTTRLDSVKQAIIMFIHAKLAINANHRFAFAAFADSANWLKKDFSSSVDSALACLRGLSASASSAPIDLTQILRAAAYEAKNSNEQNRILRVILIYCRSSSLPKYQWPAGRKLFTLDVIYLHDRPGPDNCPQNVFDALVDAMDHVTEYEGYIFESGQGLQRVLFRHMCTLLSHPQQRCLLDDLNMPKSLAKKPTAAEIVSVGGDGVPVPSQ